MKKTIVLIVGILISLGLNAKTMTNVENGEVWAITDNGAYNAENSKLIKHGDKYYGSDGRIYLRQGNMLVQIGGPRQEPMKQIQKIEIQITAPPITPVPVPILVPMHPHFNSPRDRKSINPKRR